MPTTYYVTRADGIVERGAIADGIVLSAEINRQYPGHQGYSTTPPQGWLDQVATEQAARQAAADARAQAEAAKTTHMSTARTLTTGLGSAPTPVELKAALTAMMAVIEDLNAR